MRLAHLLGRSRSESDQLVEKNYSVCATLSTPTPLEQNKIQTRKSECPFMQEAPCREARRGVPSAKPSSMINNLNTRSLDGQDHLIDYRPRIIHMFDLDFRALTFTSGSPYIVRTKKPLLTHLSSRFNSFLLNSNSQCSDIYMGNY